MNGQYQKVQVVAARITKARVGCIVAVRAVTAFGAAVVIAGVPLIAYANASGRVIVSGYDGGIYAQMKTSTRPEAAGSDHTEIAVLPYLGSSLGSGSEYEHYVSSIGMNDGAIVAAKAAPNPGPNFGSQNEYEAYITSLSPSHAAVVDSYAAPVMTDKSERGVRAAESANYPFRADGSVISLGIDRIASANANVSGYAELDVLRSVRSIESADAAPASAAPLMISPDGWPVESTVTTVQGASPVTIYKSPTMPDQNDGRDAVSLAAVPAAGASQRFVHVVQGTEPRTNVMRAPQDAAIAEYDASNSIAMIDNDSASVPNASMFSEGYTWYVDPVALSKAVIPATVAAAGSSATKNRNTYNWDADSELLLAPTIRDAQLGANAIKAPDAASTMPVMERDVELQLLYQNGYISKEMLDAELGGHVSAVPANTVPSSATSSEGYDWYIDPVELRSKTIPASRVPSAETLVDSIAPSSAAVHNAYSAPALLTTRSSEAQLEAVYQNGHVSKQVLDDFRAASVAPNANPKVRFFDGKYYVEQQNGFSIYE